MRNHCNFSSYKPNSGSNPLSSVELYNAAHFAGHQLFGDHLVFFKMPSLVVSHTTLSHLQSLDPEENYIDEYEYVFFPRRGGGMDVSSEDWHSASQEWVDDDGFIYTAWADGDIRIVKVDMTLPEHSVSSD